MKKIAVILADGFEDLEALTPVDLFRRCENVLGTTVAVNNINTVSSHGVTVIADTTVYNVNFNSYDAIILPGGMPGATNIAGCSLVMKAVENFLKSGKLVGAICASPAVVLANNGLIDGMSATCYPTPAFIDMMKSCDYTATDIEVYDNLITANGPKSAFKFALELCKYLDINPKF